MGRVLTVVGAAAAVLLLLVVGFVVDTRVGGVGFVTGLLVRVFDAVGPAAEAEGLVTSAGAVDRTVVA